MQPELSIAYLADHPEHLQQIADWVFDEWHRHRDNETLATTVERFQQHMQRDTLPLTLVARYGSEAVGTASIYTVDMLTRLDLSPWLAAVYVPQHWRRYGIGTRLVMAVEDVARRLGIVQLYLYTPDQEQFYRRLGWQVQETVWYAGEQVVLMARVLQHDCRD